MTHQRPETALQAYRMRFALAMLAVLAAAAAFFLVDGEPSAILGMALLAVVIVATALPPAPHAGSIAVVAATLAYSSAVAYDVIAVSNQSDGIRLALAPLGGVTYAAVSFLLLRAIDGADLGVRQPEQVAPLVPREVAPPVAPSDGLAAEADRAWPRNTEVAAELARASMEGRTVTLMVVEAEARAWDDRLPSLRALAQVVEETTAGVARVVSDQGARLAVLLDGAEAAAAHELAQELCRQAAERGATGLRAGIAQFPRDGTRPEDVIREAAEALAFAREAQLPVASSVLMG